MPPARIFFPPFLLQTSWTPQLLPLRYLRAVLRLPGELRPIALRSFYNIARRAQLEHIPANPSQHAVPLQGVTAPPAFSVGHDREAEKELGNGNDGEGGIRKYDGYEGLHVGNFDEREGKHELDTLEVAEKKNEETMRESIQRNGISRGRKTASSMPVHPLPSALLKTPPQTDIPPEVQEIINDFEARKPASENEIQSTYQKYRSALMGTKLAFIAATWPNIIDPVRLEPLRSRKAKHHGTYTLLNRGSAASLMVDLSPEQKNIVMNWCHILERPSLGWKAQVAELRSMEVSQIEEVNRICRETILRGQHAKTRKAFSQIYNTYWTQLLAATQGGFFDDFPSHLPEPIQLADFVRVYHLRRLSRYKLKEIKQSLSTTDGVDHPALTKEVFELSIRITGLSALLSHIDRAWEIGLDNHVRRAYEHLRENLPRGWPRHLDLVVLWRLDKLRKTIKGQLLESQGCAVLQEPKEVQYLQALDKFFDVVDDPGSFKSNARDAAKSTMSGQVTLEDPTSAAAESTSSNSRTDRQLESSANPPASPELPDIDALRQPIAALRTKLSEATQDKSRDMIEDETTSLEQSFKASSSYSTSVKENFSLSSSTKNVSTDHSARRINGIIRTVVGDYHNPEALIDHARTRDAIDRHLLRKAAQSLDGHEKNTTQAQTTLAREPPLPLDRHAKTTRARDSGVRGQDTAGIVEDRTPSTQSGVSFESGISPMFDSSFLTNQPSPQVASDSAAISDLKTQVAELKDLIRGLIFQQMTKSGTNYGPSMLASMKASPFANVSAPAAPTVKPAEIRIATPLANKDIPQETANPLSTESPTVHEAPLNITHEVYPPLKESENASSRASAQVVQSQTPQSLLAELFPEETKGEMEEEQREGLDSPARIPIPHVPLTPIDGSDAARRKPTGLDPMRRARAKGSGLTPRSAVLELRYASKSLTEEDFRCLIPRGLHMQEWTQRGEFVKVFPKRDPWTLEQTGNYYIVFNNEEDAKAYKQHVSHVHDLARQHTPTSLTSEISPSPGYIIDGEDVSGLIQSYTLIPPQQKLFLQLLVPPFTPLQQNIFKRGGYAQILGEGREGVAQVLIVFLEGRQPSYFEISDAIHLDGKRRGLEWKLVPGENAIRKVDMRESNKKEEPAPLFDRDFESEFAEGALSGVDPEAGKRKKTVQGRAKTPTYGQRWILSFESVEEAKRFALQWHGRAFPWHDRAMRKWQGKGFGEQVLMVRAEFLW